MANEILAHSQPFYFYLQFWYGVVFGISIGLAIAAGVAHAIRNRTDIDTTSGAPSAKAEPSELAERIATKIVNLMSPQLSYFAIAPIGRLIDRELENCAQAGARPYKTDEF